MVLKWLTWLKSQVTEEQFKVILNATDADIKFNRVAFGKRTSPIEYINICSITAQAVIRAGV